MNIDTQADMATKIGYLENRVKTLEEKMKRCFNYMHETTNDLFKLAQKVENMTNAEKYKEEINNKYESLECSVHGIRTGSRSCRRDCQLCKEQSIAWLMQEYEEPPVDWNKVKSGTIVWVRNSDAQSWSLREFAMYHDNRIWCYEDGLHDSMQRWNCGRLKD